MVKQDCLTYNLFQDVRRHAKQWSGTDGKALHNVKHALKYLEDRVIVYLNNSNLSLVDPEHYAEEDRKGRNKKWSLLSKFYFCTFSRYLQKKCHVPITIQRLEEFHTPNGNQIDLLLKEYFNVE